MLDKSVTREGTMLIKGGIVYLDGWEIAGGGMCREVAALACLYVARELQQRAMSLIANPGGDGRTVSDMPSETPREWLCEQTREFLEEFDDTGESHVTPQPPVPPPCRILSEGGGSGLCDICGSSLKRRWFGLGKVIGCLQPKCWNWHGWSQLPVGCKKPIDLYGAPERPAVPPSLMSPPQDTFEGPFGTVRTGTCSKCHRTSHVLSQRQGICPACWRGCWQ